MDYLKFARQLGKSKKIKRTGWVREKVKNPESVAEHCFRLIALCMVLAKELKVNQEKLVKMAIVHDLGETSIGDIVAERSGKIDFDLRKKKEEMEEKAIAQIFESSMSKEEYVALFKERVELKTEESKIFRQLDKLEMAIQALEYEEEQNANLEEFFVDADKNIAHPIIKTIMKQILESRKKEN